VAQTTNLKGLAAELSRSGTDLYHFEIGAGDSRLFQLSRRLQRQAATPQLLTIHDSAIVIWHPFDLPGSGSSVKPVRFAAKAGRLALNRSFGGQAIQRHLSAAHVTAIYLRPDLASPPTSYYLPQPTYHQAPAKPVTHPATPQRIGFCGFWDPSKGIETLLAAWDKLDHHIKLKLVIAGSTGSADDPYTQRLQRTIAASRQPIELAGFIEPEQLDALLMSLDALVLPYRSTVPGSVSGMAMRAAELGTPIIASDIPALKLQLGEAGATFVPPDDSDSLAAAITDFFHHPATTYQRSRQTQASLLATHNWKAVGQQLQTIVESVLEAHS
ncbi:MAG TPA: glycosyltransferase, partial [Candidatus Saccharimonadales bacterium]|nr:glycosyltransferase [Candidatus Saccharimonadales bacterium]